MPFGVLLARAPMGVHQWNITLKQFARQLYVRHHSNSALPSDLFLASVRRVHYLERNRHVPQSRYSAAVPSHFRTCRHPGVHILGLAYHPLGKRRVLHCSHIHLHVSLQSAGLVLGQDNHARKMSRHLWHQCHQRCHLPRLGSIGLASSPRQDLQTQNPIEEEGWSMHSLRHRNLVST
jgi:hypothetical protein